MYTSFNFVFSTLRKSNVNVDIKNMKNYYAQKVFVGSRACAANHYVIAEKLPYVQFSSGVDLANRCRITRSLSFRKIVV